MHDSHRQDFLSHASTVLKQHRYRRGMEDSQIFDEFLNQILIDKLGLSYLAKSRQAVSDEIATSATELLVIYESAVKQCRWDDLLGPFYTLNVQTNGAKKVNQEYFTPPEVSRCMAQITLHDIDFNGEMKTFCDPCVGAGSLALAFIETVEKQHGTSALEKLSVTGCDISYFGTRMFAVQVLTNCYVHQVALGELVALKGDSLTLNNITTIVHAHASDNHHPISSSDIASQVKESFKPIAPNYHAEYGDYINTIIDPYGFRSD